MQSQVRQVKLKNPLLQQIPFLIGNISMIPTNKSIKSSFPLINSSSYIASPVDQTLDQVAEFEDSSQDLRKPIKNDKYPFSAIGYLKFNRSTVTLFGTAFMIFHNIAVTSAHNLFNRDSRKFSSSPQLILGQIETQNSALFDIAYTYIPQQYIKQKDQKKAKQYDYALLILNNKKSFGEDFGFLQFQQFSFSQNKSLKQQQQKVDFHIYGYPFDKNFQLNGCKKITTMFGCSSKQIKFGQQNSNIILYHIPTEKGQSGSPILMKKNNKYYVIGIHKGGIKGLYNFGVKITSSVIKRINQWIVDFQRKSNQCKKLTDGLIINDAQIYKLIISQWENSINANNLKKNQNNINYIDLQKQQKQILLKTVSKNNFNSFQVFGSFIQKQVNSNNIKQLYLTQNRITDDGIKQFSKLKFPKLTKLSFQENLISLQGLSYLSKAAELKHFLQLNYLNLQYNNFKQNNLKLIQNQQVQQKQQALIIKFNLKNSKLKELNLKSMNLNDKDMYKLFSFFDKNMTAPFQFLQTLLLSQNHISSKGLKFLILKKYQGKKLLATTQALKTISEITDILYPSLKCLQLANNQIDKDGIQQLVKNDLRFKNLEKLKLDKNNLCKTAIQKLVSNKKTFLNLQVLDISQNDLEDAGIYEFMKGAKCFPILRVLLINKIKMSDYGINYFLHDEYKDTLKLLQKINAQGNQIQNKSVAKQNLKKRFVKAEIYL